MRAAIRLGRKVSKIALYEPPYTNDPGVQESWSQYLQELGQTLAEGRRGDAVASVHARRGASAEPGHPAGPAADARGSDA